MDDLKPILNYLSDWKSNREIKEKFELSQNQFYRLSRWLVKAGVAERKTASQIGRDCNDRITFYKAIK